MNYFQSMNIRTKFFYSHGINFLTIEKKNNTSTILNNFFNLGWTFDSNEEIIQFNKSLDYKIVTIENKSSNTVVKIERDCRPDCGLATLRASSTIMKRGRDMESTL